ncbi:hypothetical protein GGQ68_003267 [Sagittula marina]|uniref:Transmembrane protein n=1 Tax=Sagittula marina TaxID=943940 RepID=A0A7W6DVK7_9RHOB|nr:hypothetical protein [Sagittula marina]MBB3986923.1 hypothetical protein [Sagittula marina]
MPLTRAQILGTASALLLAAMALYYAVDLTRIILARSAEGLTHGVVLVMVLYFVVCPAMLAAALLNAWHFLQVLRGARPTPRLLRPGLWLIAVIWGMAWAGSLWRGSHGDAPESLLIFTLLYAGPAVLALICLWSLPKRIRPA